jgi:trehalose/maltose hydrolase-like predicted phosphorylase
MQTLIERSRANPNIGRLTVSDPARRSILGGHGTDVALHETFEAIVFDWDGTAVPDRQADASGVRERIEALCAAGVHVIVVTGTHVGNIDDQLRARPQGRGQLYVCCNRGSEVFAVTGNGPKLVLQRTASPEEDRALDRAAERTVERLRTRGIEAKVVSERINRRKIDLIPVPAWADPKKADIALLAEAVTTRLASVGIANLAEVVALAADVSRGAGLADPRITSDVKHVEIGLTDKSDSAHWAADWLSQRGITGELVLIGGDEFGSIGGVVGSDSLMMVDAFTRAVVVSVGVEPGGVPNGVVHVGSGPKRFIELLDEQLSRRTALRVPNIDLDPAWVIPLPTTRAKERVAEALGALGNGFVGTRGSREEDGQGTAPLFLVNGVYTQDGHLLPGPNWTGLERPGVDRRHSERRLLDLRGGTLVRFGNEGSGGRSMRFVSVSSPHALALRAEAPEAHLQPGDPLRPPRDVADFEGEEHGCMFGARTGRAGAEIAVAARDRVVTTAGRRVVERLAAWVVAPTGKNRLDDAYDRLAQVEAMGFDTLLAEHRAAWACRWDDAEVVIEGDPEAELAARFAVFHLLNAAADTGEAAVGARGLTGNAYAGHVFWDADVFVLPVLAAIRPAAARAMLEYRIRRLPAARAAAEDQGLCGARFPWESAGDGSDVTPHLVRGQHNELIPIGTGSQEEHIVADVAWAAAHFAAWTGDTDFLARAGRELLIDTARYWASRIRTDADGNGHLNGVMGPDEYHELVDDNAYTNVMARWNLRRGAELLFRSGDTDTAATWRALAKGLVDGWSPQRGLYEQFAGYFELEPLLMSQVAPPPVAVDVLLGAKRVAGSQLIKQADVLMLHHLVPEEVVDGSLASCMAFYEPRTAHGSSLSPAIHASLLARAGEPDRALEMFRLAVRLDLDDLTGTTAEGLHLATMGGVWHALAFGFLGVRAEGGMLAINPCLPDAWRALGLKFRFGGQPIGIRAEHDRVTIICHAPLLVRVADRAPASCEPGGTTFPLKTFPTQRSQR